jgi:hypothetical protein
VTGTSLVIHKPFFFYRKLSENYLLDSEILPIFATDINLMHIKLIGIVT